MPENKLQSSQLQVKTGGRTEIPAVVDIDPDQVGSPALRRIVEEVQNDAELVAVAGHYDRTHNRHNRGR